MLDQELLTATITGCGDVLRHQPISEAKFIPEFLPRKFRAVKVVGYSAKPCPIPCCPMGEVFLLDSYLLLLFIDLSHLNGYLYSSLHLTGLTYERPMAYVVEGGTS